MDPQTAFGAGVAFTLWSVIIGYFIGETIAAVYHFFLRRRRKKA